MSQATPVLLAIAVVAALVAGLLLYTFARPAQARAGRGVITGKTFEPAREESRVAAGARRESVTTRLRRIPDGYRFEIRLDGVTAPVAYWMEATAAAHFQVGQKVEVAYEERGVPRVWHKLLVRKLTAEEPPGAHR